MSLAMDDTGFLALFAHTVRKDWGVGVLAGETDDGKRRYLFENGEERTMARGFHQLMRRVEEPDHEQQAAHARLRGVLAAREGKLSASMRGGPTFLDQLARFRETYAEGLVDPKWAAEVRGEGAEERGSRHRDSTIREAQEQLSATALDALLSNQRFSQLWDQVTAVLRSTDLVPVTQLKQKATEGEPLRNLALAVRELLHGTATYEQRLDRFVAAYLAATGQPARWEIATVLPALVHPTQHVCVEPSAFRKQLKMTSSRAAIAALPNGSAYGRLLAVARQVSDKLTEQGEAPRDLMDARDFICVTHGPVPKARVARIKAPKPTKAKPTKAPKAQAEAPSEE